MKAYKTKRNIIPGTHFKIVEKVAKKILKVIKNKSKRTTFIKSAYFKKEKIFLNIFWSHLHNKRLPDRVRRLKYFDCAVDLIRNSKIEPIIKSNPNNKSELLYRFIGITKGGEIFMVQIKENKRTKRKNLISIIPKTKKSSRPGGSV